MYGIYSAAHYNSMDNRAEELEDQLAKLNKLWLKVDDEDEADELYGDEIAEIEAELENLYADMGAIDNYWQTRDYYASVL